MPEPLANMTTDQWQHLWEVLTTPVSWIPGMQKLVLLFVLTAGTGWEAVAYYLLLLFPVLLWVAAIWCTMLSIYTLPFRSGRIEFTKLMLLAWWDAALAVWMFWAGLARFVMVLAGWIFEILRMGVRLLAEMGKQLLNVPFSMGSQMTRTYFQPGVPWIAFVLLVGWCVLEATIFTYTLHPTISEVLAGIVGVEASPFTGPLLFIFLFFLIMGSFACLQVLGDAIKEKQVKAIIQMAVVEMFVMIFEVMFLYRELVDAITPWIAQQTGEQFRLGIGFTLTVATFGWIGIRGMTWFLFGQAGTPPLLAFIYRKPMVHEPAAQEMPKLSPEQQAWWRAPLADFKREIGWLEERAHGLMEYLTLPFLNIITAALNFAMILVSSRQVFSIPCKSLKAALDTREILASIGLQPKKVAS